MKLHKAVELIVMNMSFALLLLTGSVIIADGTSAEDEVAIKGYDPVAYFEAVKAIKGSGSFTFRWHKMTWHFSTKANRDLFTSSPEKYAPQYDGYCAWAMTEARLAKTDPEVWKIIDGKLYLNCSQEAYEKWSRDIPGHIKKANAIWLEHFSKK